MAIVRLFMLALAALLTPATASAQEPDIVVRGEAARTEIERILNADNLDTARLNPRQVADAIAAIERGRAPDDFWQAYQAHVRAWGRLADAVEQMQRRQVESAFAEGETELRAAAAAVETTFDEVEAIARRYGARLPAPRVDTRAIT